jgi:glycosyl transferase family 25
MENRFRLLNDYYDNIYVLSVLAATERRKLFAERFNGLNYDFFYGADKNKFTVEELVEKNIYDENLTRKNHRYGKLMKPGELACAWSHKMMYEDTLRNNCSRVLIFEDDAVPDPEIVRQIPEILSEIPADCELLMWGWAKNGETNFTTALKQTWYHIQHQLGLLKWNHTTIKNLFAKPFSAHLKKAGFHDYAYCYAVTKSGAEKLLQMQTPVQYIADNLLAYACVRGLINGYIVYPPVFLHDNLPDGSARDSYIR